MRNEIIDKLRRELSSHICTEPQVVYILVEIRKLLDQEDVRDKYRTLEFYCDWALHPHLTRNKVAHQVVKEFDDVATPSAVITQRLQEVISLIELRNELEAFLDKYGLPKEVTDKPPAWLNFGRIYADIISDCPLICKDPSLKNVDQVRFTRIDPHSEQSQSTQARPLVIECEATKNGKVVETVTFQLDIIQSEADQLENA